MTPIKNDRRLGAAPTDSQQSIDDEHTEAQHTGEVFEGQEFASDL